MAEKTSRSAIVKIRLKVFQEKITEIIAKHPENGYQKSDQKKTDPDVI